MKYQLSLAGLLALAQQALAQCEGTFEDISAADFLDAANPAWNLGNTLDAIPDEGSWNNAPVIASTFDAVKAAGFKSVRIPVTYTHHFISEGPNYEVDPEWLQRVSDVIDFALERDLLVVTNVHHDSWEWADVTVPGADVDAIMTKFRALWVQIGNKLACKPDTVAFESINEPPADTPESGADVNRFNEVFLDALSETGDWNSRRVVTFAGGNNDPIKTSQWFEPPAEVPNPWALQVHYYSPYDFVFSAWGRTYWGTEEDKSLMAGDFDVVRGNFTDVPIYIGEFDATPRSTEPAARWRWVDHFMSVATELGATVALWDNGLDHLNRDTGEWRDPTYIDIIKSVINGEENSLPVSTIDGSAPTQDTSAFIFNQVGDTITDRELPYEFNGNTLVSITNSEGEELDRGSAYTVGSSSITFTADFIGNHIEEDSAAGVYEEFTLNFSEGASPTVRIVQWDTPVLGSTVGSAADANVNGDIVIPVEWNGLDRLATVKFETESGACVFDDWTQWLGPLQQCRGTWEGQWSFEGDNLIIRSAVVNAGAQLNEAIIVTFEFYPRVEGNVAEYRLEPFR